MKLKVRLRMIKLAFMFIRMQERNSSLFDYFSEKRVEQPVSA